MTGWLMRLSRSLAAVLAGVALLGCGEGAQQQPQSEQPESKPANAEGSLPKEGPAALAPLIGRWATRPEHCAAASSEAGALMDIAETGLTSGSMSCSFGKIERRGPRYDIVGNCSAEASGPVPDERLIFVFTGGDNFEWRTEEGAIQFAYLRCPR